MDEVDDALPADLPYRAAKAGYELRNTHSGWILRKGTYSWHCGDAKTFTLLANRVLRGKYSEPTPRAYGILG